MDRKTYLLGAPLDSGAIYRPGARFGPDAIRAALTMYSLNDSSEFDPSLRASTLTQESVVDLGDADILIGDHQQSLKNIKKRYAEAWQEGYFLIVLGGDHSVSIPIFEMFSERNDEVSIVVIDAHLDYRSHVKGVANTNASVLFHTRKIRNLNSLIHVGFRNVGNSSEDAFDQLTMAGADIIDAEQYSLNRFESLVRQKLHASRCYLSIDLDGIDPSEAPGVGTPSPGGLHFSQIVEIIRVLVNNTELTGMDIVELTPLYDNAGQTSILAAQLILEVTSKRLQLVTSC